LSGASLNKEKDTIGSMFDSIAWKYDFLNHFLSFGTDKTWRRKAIDQISGLYKNPVILDVATGTADLALAAVKISPISVTGIDISEKMLELGREKIKAEGLTELIKLIRCDSENICFPENTFDVAMVAFGVRNFSDPVRGLSEMRRVICRGGMVIVLEFSRPDRFPFRNLYNFYFRYLLPVLGRWLSKDRTAYTYLHESVMKFAENEDFIKLMKDAGLSDIRQKRLTNGVATIYTGIKE
jgi:demethylmenaquinone methyltransferase/2-methoxy-6-polyprenyl-1,4-benzoquinol methylase